MILPASNPDGFYRGRYIETFAIGGGAAFMYATIELGMKICIVLKQAGVPYAGQIVQVYDYLMKLPLVSAVLVFILGGSNRHAYKVSAAAKHPKLRDYWNPMHGNLCQKAALVPSPTGDDMTPFPYTKVGVRGTPEHHPFSDFDNAIFANERGSLFDQIINGGSRGFRLRFKTGNKMNTGARDLFHIVRATPSIIYFVVDLLKLVLCFVCTLCSGSKGKTPAADGVQVESADRSKILGYVRKTTQLTRSDSFANRFNKRSKPVYDILDANENILYTVYIPIRPYRFGKSIPGLMSFLDQLGTSCCCCSSLVGLLAYADMDYFAIVKGERPKDKMDNDFKFCKTFNRDVGWNVRLTPKNEQFIDTCLGRAKCVLKLCCVPDSFFNVLNAMATLFRTFPVDHWTQVMRNTFMERAKAIMADRAN